MMVLLGLYHLSPAPFEETEWSVPRLVPFVLNRKPCPLLAEPVANTLPSSTGVWLGDSKRNPALEVFPGRDISSYPMERKTYLSIEVALPPAQKPRCFPREMIGRGACDTGLSR